MHNYTLRRFSDDVVADNFKFGGDREIVSLARFLFLFAGRLLAQSE